MKKGIRILGESTIYLLIGAVLIIVFAYLWMGLDDLIAQEKESISQPYDVYKQLVKDIIESEKGEHSYRYNALSKEFFILTKDGKLCLCRDRECKKEPKCQLFKSVKINEIIIEGKGEGLSINIKREGNSVIIRQNIKEEDYENLQI